MKDANSESCLFSLPVSIHETPAPNVLALGPTEFCASKGESCTLDGGVGYASYQWQIDGADLPGATAQTCAATQSGTFTVVVTDGNGCTGTSAGVVLNAENCAGNPPGEVSEQWAGEPPLLVTQAGSKVTVEKEPNATAYNVYADALGSWYYPTPATGTVCTIRTWTDNGDGTVTLDYVVPGDSWIVVTASNPDGEGPAGNNGDGVERTTLGVWELCGAAP